MISSYSFQFLLKKDHEQNISTVFQISLPLLNRKDKIHEPSFLNINKKSQISKVGKYNNNF